MRGMPLNPEKRHGVLIAWVLMGTHWSTEVRCKVFVCLCRACRHPSCYQVGSRHFRGTQAFVRSYCEETWIEGAQTYRLRRGDARRDLRDRRSIRRRHRPARNCWAPSSDGVSRRAFRMLLATDECYGCALPKCDRIADVQRLRCIASLVSPKNPVAEACLEPLLPVLEPILSLHLRAKVWRV